jgi:hypothetical protein
MVGQSLWAYQFELSHFFTSFTIGPAAATCGHEDEEGIFSYLPATARLWRSHVESTFEEKKQR